MLVPLPQWKQSDIHPCFNLSMPRNIRKAYDYATILSILQSWRNHISLNKQCSGTATGKDRWSQLPRASFIPTWASLASSSSNETQCAHLQHLGEEPVSRWFVLESSHLERDSSILKSRTRRCVLGPVSYTLFPPVCFWKVLTLSVAFPGLYPLWSTCIHRWSWRASAATSQLALDSTVKSLSLPF
jgi:hypothetical protein